MSIPQVTIQLVTCNSRRLLPYCLPSILDQTFRDFQVLIIDNNSQDGTVEYIKNNYPQITVFQNNKNLGFARANNQGIKLFKSPYVVFCNPDIVLESDWLELMMAIATSDKYSSFGSFGCKLLKLKVIDSESGDLQKSDMIDSCGLKVLRNHRVVELGAGEAGGKHNDTREVFGQSGALFLCKREALDKVLLKDKFHPNGDYFDSNFFFYKEDVDLAWRLQLGGYRSLFIAAAVAYHLRTFSGSDSSSLGEVIGNRKRQSKIAKYYSYRNHLLVLLEDEFARNWLYCLPQILWYESKKFLYILAFETSNLKAFWEIFLMMPQIINKRKIIFSRCGVNAREIRNWLNQ